MMNDVTFFAKMLNRMDNMDKYLEYLGNDYLPKTAKRMTKNFKNLYGDFVVLGIATFAGGYLLYKENKKLKKQLKDANEHLALLDQRLDVHINGMYAEPSEEDIANSIDADDLNLFG